MFNKKPDSDMSNSDIQKPITRTTSKATGAQPATTGQPIAPIQLGTSSQAQGYPAASQETYYAPKPPAFKGSDRMAPSIIGEDLKVTGNVHSQGEVQVEGVVEGDVRCSSLVVGEKASILGGIVAEDVVVRGKVTGSVRGNRVTLQASSVVDGDVYHKSLAIEQGAYFEGKSRRSEDPIGTAPSSSTQPTSNAAQ